MENAKSLFISFLLVIGAFYLIKFILVRDKTKSFTDFLIGDTGKYSLSRLQATVWAVVIITYQVAVMLTMHRLRKFDLFELVFSEEAIWLLGLSLGSYITVKGITVNQMANLKPQNFTIATQRKWSDLITSDEGLDLSRFQMLIWTIIAVIVFLNSVDTYLTHIIDASEKLGDTELQKLFPKFEFNDPKGTLLPTIDMSFLALMGLSQGAYIGRKLVPSHKVAEFKQEYMDELQLQISTMDLGLRFKEAEFEMIKNSYTVPPEQKVKAAAELEIIKERRKKLDNELKAVEAEKANLT
jgi:hypothetical protein